ncbi:MAG TPA: shikimate kinase [Anaeromyxobacteraceae bacterium]|nr:shikimate kinase [Anaeromyxobacteraceae bacterium]
MPLGSAEALALAGMMGSGKTTVAAELARLLGRRVVSTDAEVVRRAGKPIAAVFAEDGEAAFRALERAVVASLAGPVVVDLGGGAFCDPATAGRLLATARVVFLDVSPAEAARRIAADPGAGVRPLLERWAALAARRRPLYLRAHHRVEVDGLAPEAVARRILELVAPPRREPLLEGA